MDTCELILNYVASVHSVGVVLTYQGPNTKIHKGTLYYSWSHSMWQQLLHSLVLKQRLSSALIIISYDA
jgi:hypothetical protein